MPGATLRKGSAEATAASADLLDLVEDLFGFRPPTLSSKTTEVEPKAPEEVASTVPAMTGKDLLEQPWSTLDAAGREGNQALMDAYRKGRSPLHYVRSDCQPVMLKSLLRSTVPAMVEDLLDEVGMDTPSARLLAEQVAEARADESYARMLSGMELEKAQVAKAERLVKIADRHSKRMASALEQLHRLRRPKVNVRIDSAKNVNLGDQRIVNRSVDTLDAHTSERQGRKKRAAG